MCHSLAVQVTSTTRLFSINKWDSAAAANVSEAFYQYVVAWVTPSGEPYMEQGNTLPGGAIAPNSTTHQFWPNQRITPLIGKVEDVVGVYDGHTCFLTARRQLQCLQMFQHAPGPPSLAARASSAGLIASPSFTVASAAGNSSRQWQVRWPTSGPSGGPYDYVSGGIVPSVRVGGRPHAAPTPSSSHPSYPCFNALPVVAGDRL